MEMMKQQIRQRMAPVDDQLGAPEKDKEAVRPHMEDLREVFEYDPAAG